MAIFDPWWPLIFLRFCFCFYTKQSVFANALHKLFHLPHIFYLHYFRKISFTDLVHLLPFFAIKGRFTYIINAIYQLCPSWKKKNQTVAHPCSVEHGRVRACWRRVEGGCPIACSAAISTLLQRLRTPSEPLIFTSRAVVCTVAFAIFCLDF